MSKEELHPLIWSINCTLSDMMRPFHAIKPFSVYHEKDTIDKILDASLNSSIDLGLDRFKSLNHAFAIISISGWILQQNSFSQLQNNLRNSFVWSVWSYLTNNPELKSLFLKSIFGDDVTEKENLIMPLTGVSKNIPFSNDNFIENRCLFVPPHVYMDRIPGYIESSFDNMIQSFEDNIQPKIKKEIELVFTETIESLKTAGKEKGPWILYGCNIDPLFKFAVDLLKQNDKKQTYSLSDIRDIISQYIPKHKWDSQFKEHLLTLSEEDLIQVYKKAFLTKKIPELEYVSSHSISIKENTKMSFICMDDFEQLRTFPCIDSLLNSKTVPHKVLTALFSILLWFYTKEECHHIIKNKINSKNYDVRKTEKQISSLVDNDGLPRYIYGTKGFANYCIGYDRCPGCWITHINFPEEYYEKKRKLRKSYLRSSSKDSQSCSISPTTLRI